MTDGGNHNPGQAAAVDIDRLKALYALDTRSELVEILNEFLDNMQPLLTRLAQAMDKKDRAELALFSAYCLRIRQVCGGFSAFETVFRYREERRGPAV